MRQYDAIQRPLKELSLGFISSRQHLDYVSGHCARSLSHRPPSARCAGQTDRPDCRHHHRHHFAAEIPRDFLSISSRSCIASATTSRRSQSCPPRAASFRCDAHEHRRPGRHFAALMTRTFAFSAAVVQTRSRAGSGFRNRLLPHPPIAAALLGRHIHWLCDRQGHRNRQEHRIALRPV